MSQHILCPDCQDKQKKDLHDLVHNKEMSCCQDKKSTQPKVKEKSGWQKFISTFKK